MKNGVPLFLSLLAGFVIVSAPANAADKTSDSSPVQTAAVTVDPIHDIIVKQLKAFRDRDAAAAYALTSTDIREKYLDAKAFLHNVRVTYRALYENASYTFLERSEINGSHIQKMEIVDSDGKTATVLCRIVKNDSGEWMIDSYMVLESDAQPI